MTFDNSSVDHQIFNEIIKKRQDWLGIRDWNHPRYELYDYPQRLCLLSDMNRVYILREIGDTKAYIKYEETINQMPLKDPSPQDICILQMAKWTQSTIDYMKPIESEKEKVIISLLVYGAEYTKKCLNVVFKSLMAGGNLPTLCKEKTVILYIQTDEVGKLRIENSGNPIIEKMKEIGVNFQYAFIPDSLMNQIDHLSVYWLVGAAATLGLEYARINNAVFHHAYPDIIYSDKFFSELLRLSKEHKSILSPAHRSDQVSILREIKKYENDECIKIASADLVALSLNCIHMCHWPTIVNNRPSMWVYPQHHYLVWESHQFVHFNCPHLNAIWLSAETVKKCPQRFYISLDSELDFVCEDENYYIPQEMDDLYLVEFSNQGKAKVEDMYVDAQNYAFYFWKLSTNRDNFKFFTRGMKLKINRQIRPSKENTMDENNVMNEKCNLYNTTISKDPGPGTTLSRPRTHQGRLYGITQVVQSEESIT